MVFLLLRQGETFGSCHILGGVHNVTTQVFGRRIHRFRQIQCLLTKSPNDRIDLGSGHRHLELQLTNQQRNGSLPILDFVDLLRCPRLIRQWICQLIVFKNVGIQGSNVKAKELVVLFQYNDVITRNVAQVF